MISEQGVIKEIRHKKAFIRIQSNSACDHCESRGACHLISDKEMMIEVPNDLDAQVGDLVDVSLPTQSFIKISLLVYLLPVVSLIIGAYTGEILAPSFHVQPTIASIIGGGFAVGITIYVLKKIDRVVKMKDTYQPRMTRIIRDAGFPRSNSNR